MEDCARGIISIDIDLFNDISSLVKARQDGDPVSTEKAKTKALLAKDRFIGFLIDAYRDMRMGRIGDTFPLLKHVIEFELARYDSISEAIIRCVEIAHEQFQFRYQHGVHLAVQEVTKHMKFDPLLNYIEEAGSNHVDKSQTSSSVTSYKQQQNLVSV
ncbi:hypothetical protein RF11_04855 [Thelohanellus kitauei]|uniref:Uncharacterized protein n=1 Tax=Thelohanellus kitauei TaxID=669202 RepID=A0A0C2JC15_THEKT|nr:hypothetical protein RF11_04855 [Thelohanellus kitauei]